jgi:thioredoxin reductase (NADPH)
VKYWIRPDLENRIAEGSIRALFRTTVEEIRERTIVLATPDGRQELANDWVLALTGYHPDYGLLDALGIRIDGDEFRTPVFDPVTFESSRAGVYLAGTVCGGYRTGRWFIENGRHHARQIVEHLTRGRVEPVAFDAIRWKTEE